MSEITIENRNLFFEYLEEQGLSPDKNKSILEVAPSILTSQSFCLVEKYGELYKQFLVSRRFEQESFKGIPVKGMLGQLILEKGDLAVPVPTRDKLRSYYNVLKHAPFDTLLIQGQMDDAYSLVKARQQLLFGDVCEKPDYVTRKAYYDLVKVIQMYNEYGEYEMHHDRKDNHEYYLIMRKE